MNTWRAKRYSVTINRRHRVNITVRRFRLAKKQYTAGKSQPLLLNVRLGRLRQISIDHKSIKRRTSRGADFGLRFNRRQRTALAGLLIITGLCGVTFSAAALAKPTNLQPANRFAVVQPVAAKPRVLPKSVPVHIEITSQNIDTDLVAVGLNDDATIELPPALDAVAGWYKFSPTPGELGPAVIVGHVDNYESTSIFWRLRYVVAGDTINVVRADDTTAHFKVTQLAQYDQATFPTETVYGNTKDSELRVITCGGTFDSTTGHYTQNTVIYATLVS
ncbi:class F sortase [Aeromicrobium sp.]|nr:class F sortase [Candidatus Saccharibacteria bacterium]